jgi:cell shape-determining protein MreC
MARVLTIFSILIGLATAFLGWKTRENAIQLQSNLTDAKSAQRTAEGKQKTAEKARDEATTKLEEQEATLKKAQEDLTNTRGELQNLKADYDKAKADVDEKSKRLAEVEAAMKSITTPGVSPEQMGAQVKELSDAKNRLQTELDEAKQVQETLREKAEAAEGQLASKEQTIKSYQGPIVQRGLSGKVLAYNPGWNFVVLNIGDRAGLRNGVQMVVTRGGAMVGRVRVTTVEPSTAIADVLPGTLAKGQSVQPGDSVIFQGGR